MQIPSQKQIENSNNISFQYSHPLKTAYKRNLMPEVKYGIYGKKLNKKTVSIEHITPHSLGGKTSWDNVFLADRYENSARGIKPEKEVFTNEMIIKYLKQFISVKNKFVDGMQYIKTICKRFEIDIKEILK